MVAPPTGPKTSHLNGVVRYRSLGGEPLIIARIPVARHHSYRHFQPFTSGGWHEFASPSPNAEATASWKSSALKAVEWVGSGPKQSALPTGRSVLHYTPFNLSRRETPSPAPGGATTPHTIARGICSGIGTGPQPQAPRASTLRPAFRIQHVPTCIPRGRLRDRRRSHR
jgi:hypothetical protein